MSEQFLYFLQQMFNGVTLGSTYALIAIGYTMVYGIIGMNQLRPRRGLYDWQLCLLHDHRRADDDGY
ncbi:high-affinity branched-chain amino acid transporter permease LivH [Klebsiella pneumoniae]|uniref:High-affinity branched-chain amino acid transporter permease LivH n=1 Tax=Klebsiella pneumoniae TaxID=573 RepID=A0A378FQ20_KLEPN|nr:high-affinity branched-chain amino acid transporter permease LivH [Klebsiella pneumoniae]